MYEPVASSDDWDEWLRVRSRSVTATDVARLASGGPKVWATVRAEKQGVRSFVGNEFTEHGKRREPVIAKWAEAELNMAHNTTFLVRTGTNHGATPDLMTHDDSLVGDIKTSKLPESGKWVTPPQNYIDQLIWQMYIVGAEGAALVVEFHEDFRPVAFEPRVYWVDRNDDRLDYLLDLAHQFTNEGPAPVMDGLLARYLAADRQERRFAAHKAKIKAEMLDLIGERESFKHVSELGAISYSTPKPREMFQLDKFRESNPDLAEQFTLPGRVPKPSLRITPAKDEG